MNPFTVGQAVVLQDSHKTLTAGKVYTVTDVHGYLIEVCDDMGRSIRLLHTRFELAAIPQGAMSAGNRATARSKALKATCGTSIYLDPELSEVLAEAKDYDTRKAQQRVTSSGVFQVGTVVVYRDGTPTNTTLTVKRCTATCVWFEETYSTAFDPNEFTQGY